MISTLKPQGCTNFKLRRLSRQLSRLYDARVAQSGLKTSQYSLLSSVLHLGPLRPGELAQALDVDASTLTRNLKPLVGAGLLALEEGSDARSRQVSITDAGRKKRTEAQRYWKRAQEEVNALLGVDRVAELHALIDTTSALLESVGAHAQGEEDVA